MDKLPVFISLVFEVTTVLTVILFYKATERSRITLVILASWLALQAVVGLSGFYTVTNTFPPRFLLLPLPPVIVIVGLFLSPRGRQYIDSLDTKILTILHTIRIPVEFVLLWLFMNNVVPQLMTFEGRNFDIISGLTAPAIFYFGYIKRRIDRKLILLWNIICLGLLINIVVNAVFSVPFPFQKFGFEQPNIAVLYFPFIWLPACVVPLVLLSHLATIRQLLRQQ
jgi:hypothetical protein